MSGYALIYRSLLDHPAFRNDAEAMAFGWMIVRASWRDADVRYKGHRITLKRGQLAISQRDMARHLDRDKAWVERLWKRLRSEAMIKADVKAGVAVITICNYAEYQRSSPTGEALAEAVENVDMRQTQGSGEAQNNEGKELNKIGSEANASGAEPPADPIKEVFDLGVSILVASGKLEGEARSLIGKWRKAKSDAEVLTGLIECRSKAISDPVEWLTKRFQPAKWVSKSGYEYRGSDSDVMREAERRGDNDTYWAVKAAMAREPKAPPKRQRGRGSSVSIGNLVENAMRATA